MTAVLENGSAVAAAAVLVSELLAGGSVSASPLACVAVDRSGVEVPAWLVVEPAGAGGNQRRCAVIERGPGGAVLAAGAVSAVSVSSPRPEAEVPGWVSVLASATWDAQAATAERDTARILLNEQRARLESIVDSAHQYANDNDLCERFDEFMESHGLRRRDREFTATVRATVEVRVSVSGSTADVAAAAVDDQMIADVLDLMGRRGLCLAITGHEVMDTEEA